MGEIATAERLLWALNFFLNAALVLVLLYRKNHRSFPFLFVYALVNVLQSVVLFESYRIVGFDSVISKRIAWGSQGLVTVARAGAVAEVCRLILARYRGVWQLAWRLLLGSGALIAFYALAASGGNWGLVILNLDRGLELAMSSVIVLLFVFAQYYEVCVETALRTVAIGFFLYSTFRVLNDTIWGRWMDHYTALWGLLGTITFLASLLLWTWALRRAHSETAFALQLHPDNLYSSLTPEINARLKTLNEQLGHLWRTEGEKT